MLKDSLETLSAIPPRKLILNIRRANARIRELETRLGLPHEKGSFNVARANITIRALEAQLSQTRPAQPAAQAPQVTATPEAPLVKSARLAAETRELLSQSAALRKSASPPAPAALPTAPIAPVLSRQQCLAIHREVFGTGVLAGGMSDAVLLANTLTKIQGARLTLPGTPKVDCGALSTREKAFREMRQDRLNSVLKTVK